MCDEACLLNKSTPRCRWAVYGQDFGQEFAGLESFFDEETIPLTVEESEDDHLFEVILPTLRLSSLLC